MLMATEDGDIVDRAKPGRKRARQLSDADRREQLLQVAFRQISVSSPDQLRALVQRCEMFVRVAKVRGDRALASHALEIGLRAARRLNALKRAV